MNFMIVKKNRFSDYVRISPVFQTEFSAKQAGYDIKKIFNPMKFHFENGFIIKERYQHDPNNICDTKVREHRIESKNVDVYVDDRIHLLEFELIKKGEKENE